MSVQDPPYRNADDEVARHAKRLLAAQRKVDDKKLGALYRHRCARIGFGYTGSVAGVFALIAIAAADSGQIHALALAWAAAFTGGLLGYLIGYRDFARRTKCTPRATDDPYTLVIQLTNPTASDGQGDHMLTRIEKLGLASHRYPLLVGAMLLPLTLVTGFFALGDGEWSDMGTKFAFIYTVHVHVYAAIAAWHYPHSRKAFRTIAIATGLGVLPFIVSGLFVGVTAAVITVCFFMPLSSWMDHENSWIAIEKDERSAATVKPEDRALPGAGVFPGATNAARNTAAVANPL